jgi:hypothetical protein
VQGAVTGELTISAFAERRVRALVLIRAVFTAKSCDRSGRRYEHHAPCVERSDLPCAQSAIALLGKIKLAAVDCTENKALTERFDVKSYPTLKL